jgi:hypothetical protein
MDRETKDQKLPQGLMYRHYWMLTLKLLDLGLFASTANVFGFPEH